MTSLNHRKGVGGGWWGQWACIEGSENIGQKYQRVSRSINYHKFASYTIVGVFCANNNKNRKQLKVYNT